MNEESLFHRALALPVEERQEFLERECAGDVALRQRVDILMHAHQNPGSFLAAPLPELPRTVPYFPEEGLGSSIGSYKLLQQIGEGGMGIVYMAEQREPVQRKVALKIIKPGMDSQQVIARFEAERQALAMMDHLNIAKVFDAGTTQTGRPYFVMELVHGVPLTKFCDDRKLTPRQRLELFVPVCQAVQHAHQKGIIHRDLKPSNILVTLYDDRPVPKVIDFGIAKAIDQRLTEKTLFTQFGTAVGTFEYMSPEQAEMNALGVDTRSDVYSLGVLLYELLTGTTPLENQRVRAAAYGEIVRLIKEEEPPRPSLRLSASGERLTVVSQQRGTDPGELTRLIRGELDWIVMRCLEKDRTQRYDSASGLARDVVRYLGDEPVEACPPSHGYRLRKLYRRNRVAILGIVAMVVVLLIATGISLIFAFHAEQSWRLAIEAEINALQERDKAVASETLVRESKEKELATQKLLRRSLYSSNLNLIQVAWEENHASRVLELLKFTRPEPSEEDLRGFEWHYWDRLCHTEDGRTTLDFGPTVEKNRGDFVTFSANGTRCAAIVMGNPAKTTTTHIKVWDIVEKREMGEFPLEDTRSQRIALSGDGKRLAAAILPTTAGGNLGKILVWDISSRNVLATFPISMRTRVTPRAPTQDTRPVLNHDGKYLAAFVRGQPDGPSLPGVMIWDVDRATTSKPVMHPGAESTFALSPDGAKLATLALGMTKEPERALRYELRIRDTSMGKILKTGPWPLRPGPEAKIGPNAQDTALLVYSPDGSRIAGFQAHRASPTASPSFQGAIWDANGKPLATVEPPSRVLHISFNSNGKYLATWTGMRHPVGIVWNASTGEALQTWKGPIDPVVAATFVRDSMIVSSVDLKGQMRFWDISQEAVRRFLPEANTWTVWSLNGDHHAVFGHESGTGVISLRDAFGRERLSFKDHKAQISEVQLGMDGRYGVSLDLSGEVKVWNTATGKVVINKPWSSEEKVRPTAKPAFRWSEDGRRLAMRVPEGGVKVWDFKETVAEVFTCKTTTQTPILSPDGRFLATPTVSESNPSEREVTVWDVDLGKRLGVFQGEIKSIVFSPNGHYLAARFSSAVRGNSPNTPVEVKVWNTITGEMVAHLKEGIGNGGLAFSPDGKLLAISSFSSSGHEQGDVLIWDMKLGKLGRALKGHTSTVLELAFSPDGRRLVSTAQPTDQVHGEVIVWDPLGGDALLTLKTRQPLSQSHLLGFTLGGNRLSVVGKNSSGEWIQIWEAAPR